MKAISPSLFLKEGRLPAGRKVRARGLTGEALQTYNRGVILAQENHSKVLGGAVVYAYGAPRDGEKMNFDTVLKSEGLGTVEERLLAHVNAFPGSRKFLAGLPEAQQVLIGDIQRKQNPTDTAFLQFLSPSAQEKVRAIIAREKSETVRVSGQVQIERTELVAMLWNNRNMVPGKLTLGTGTSGEGSLLGTMDDRKFLDVVSRLPSGGGLGFALQQAFSSMASYIVASADQVIRGNYSDNVTVLGTVLQVASGIVNIDLPADLRDVAYDLDHWEWSFGHVGQTSLDGIGVVPVIGSLKYGDEVFALFRKADGSMGVARDAVRSEQEATRAAVQVLDVHKMAKIEEMIAHVAGEHIGKSIDELKARIKKDGIPVASSFKDYETAKNIIMDAIRQKTPELDEWAKNFKLGQRLTYDISYNVDSNVGTIVRSIKDLKGTIVDFSKSSPSQAIIRVKYDGNGGWTLLTSFLQS